MTQEKIANLSVYNSRMSRGLYDKLFFLPRVNTSVYVDFGCADGVLLAFLAEQFPENIFFGYDNSDEMLEIARTRCSQLPNVTFTSSWNKIANAIVGRDATLILSSVIHEVYSYAEKPEDIDAFWKKVFSSNFKHIAIRDMSISAKNANRIIDLETVAQIRKNSKWNKHLQEFEARYGEISSGINYLHYLLKYSYTENWVRELAENYLPLTQESLLAKIPDEYRISYMSDFLLPYLKETVEKEFSVTVAFSSHLKLILTKR